MAEQWQPGDPLPGAEPINEIGIAFIKPDHDEPCALCRGTGVTHAAARWNPAEQFGDLDRRDRTAEVARGTR